MKTRSNKLYSDDAILKKTKNIVHDKNYEKVLDKFMDNIESIYDGSFFERIPIEDQREKIKNQFTLHDLKTLNIKMNSMRNLYKNSSPSVIDILNLNIPTKQKQFLLEKIHTFVNSEILTGEYNSNLKILDDMINNKIDDSIIQLEQKIIELSETYGSNNELKNKILTSNMSMQNKIIAYNKFKILASCKDESDSEYFKYKTWIDSLLQVPFNIYKKHNIDISNTEETRKYLKNIRNTLDNKLSFLEKPKDQLMNMIIHSLKNENAQFNAIGLHGVKGVGKTSLISSISKATDRPFRIISLGGESDVSVINGHNFTYVGSIPGRIIDILKETKCMNPIILFDELDKVSESPQGKEIIGALIHLTDSTTNKKYTYDRYFSGIEFDLSKVMFFFTYNDASSINKILADRLYKIEIPNYSDKEKFTITKEHLIPEILNEYFFKPEDIIFNDNIINYLIKKSNENGGKEGMRDIKRKLQIIISRINVLTLTEKSDNIIKLNYNCLYNKTLPINLTTEDIDILLKNSDNNESNINNDVPFHMYM
jgi:ATP-dependent Lon protease